MEFEPLEELQSEPSTSLAPQYHVILHDDDKHTYIYVMAMCMQLFGKSKEQAYGHAKEVDTTGVTILLTTHFEHAELKKDQIRAYGPDPYFEGDSPPMSVSLEPA